MAATVAELVASLGLDIQEGQFAAGTKAIEGIANALKALAVFKGVQLFERWIMQTGELADAAKKTGERMGITAESVQELQYAAKNSDTSLEALQGGLKRVDRLLSGFGGKKGAGAAAALHDLGLAAKDLKDLPFDEKLDKLADGFKRLDDQKAIQVANKLGLGTGPLLLLKSGSDGIREMREEARLLGLVIDNETAAAFEAWNDDLARVKGAIQGLKNDAVVALLPTLKQLTENLFAWIKANRELIRQRLEVFLKLLVSLAQGLIKTLGVVYELFERIAPVIGEITTALSELLSIGNEAGDELMAVAVAVGAAFALANLPIILLVAFISAAVLVVNSLWRAFQGKDSALKELADAFTEALGESGVGRVVLGLRASFEALFAYLDSKVQWLKELGELFSDAADMQRGSTQFRLDEATTGSAASAAKLQNVRGVLKPDAPDAALKYYGLNDQEIDAYRTRVKGFSEKVNDLAPSPTQATVVQKFADDQNYAKIMAEAAASNTRIDNALLRAKELNTTLAPQLSVTVNVTGQAEADLPDKIAEHVDQHFNAALRDAQVATGARGGRIP